MKVRSEREVAQASPTLHNLMGLPGSSAHGIFQARVLEWVAITFSSILGLPWWPGGKGSTCNVGDLDFIPELVRFPGGGLGNSSSILV